MLDAFGSLKIWLPREPGIRLRLLSINISLLRSKERKLSVLMWESDKVTTAPASDSLL